MLTKNGRKWKIFVHILFTFCSRFCLLFLLTFPFLCCIIALLARQGKASADIENHIEKEKRRKAH